MELKTRLRLNRTWKVSIIYTWVVKTLHSVLSSFVLSLVLVLPSLYLPSTVPWLRCFLFFNAANRRLRSVLDSAKRARCGGPTALSYPSSIVKKRRSSLSSIAWLCQCTWCMSSSACTWAQIDIPERDRHVCALQLDHSRSCQAFRFAHYKMTRSLFKQLTIFSVCY